MFLGIDLGTSSVKAVVIDRRHQAGLFATEIN
jgi:sugar (pentulose or hexulose) kinase